MNPICYWYGCKPDTDLYAMRCAVERAAQWNERQAGLYVEDNDHRYQFFEADAMLLRQVLWNLPQVTGHYCQRCHSHDIPYRDLVGDTRHNRAKAWLRYWFYGRWHPAPCTCGKVGEHPETDDCLPF